MKGLSNLQLNATQNVEQSCNQWIDIGVNLTNKRFDKDREAVILSAQAVGVIKQLVTGTNLKESQAALDLVARFPDQLRSTAGCHPHDADNFTPEHCKTLAELATRKEVLAIGECGLDFNRNFSTKENQLRVFEQQLALACDVGKPVFLHERDAFDEQKQLLAQYRPNMAGGVVHCFTGNKEQLETYISMDLYIGITGWICDERRGQELLNLLPLIPDDRLLIETDAPYLTPRDLKPKPKSSRNLPEYLPHIAQKIANKREVNLSELSKQCYANTVRLFNFD